MTSIFASESTTPFSDRLWRFSILRVCPCFRPRARGFGLRPMPTGGSDGYNPINPAPTAVIFQAKAVVSSARKALARQVAGSPSAPSVPPVRISPKWACPSSHVGKLGPRASGYVGAGYFQPEEGQFGCIGCDSLGDFYQDQRGATACVACPANSVRYIGVLSAETKSSCQCKEGDTSQVRCCRRNSEFEELQLLDAQATTMETADLERCVFCDAFAAITGG
jgi:hypothetical protein